jgi:hypothetical protein
VAARLCAVSFTSATGISHSVTVEAETLFEAAGLGLARLKADGWVEGLGPGTKLEIHVREPGTSHTVSVQQLQRWMISSVSSPAETLRKARVKNLLKV